MLLHGAGVANPALLLRRHSLPVQSVHRTVTVDREAWAAACKDGLKRQTFLMAARHQLTSARHHMFTNSQVGAACSTHVTNCAVQCALLPLVTGTACAAGASLHTPSLLYHLHLLDHCVPAATKHERCRRFTHRH